MIGDNLQILITIGQIIIAGIVAFATASYKFGKLEQRIEHLEEDNKDNKSEIRGIGKDVSEVRGQLSANNPATYLRRKSPVTINERGLELLKHSGGEKFIEDNKEEMIEKLKTIGRKTAYDIQENSKIVVKSYQDDDRFTPIKEFVFKQGIDLEIVLLMMSLHLRDIALEKFNFTDIDIDKSDPTLVSK